MLALLLLAVCASGLVLVGTAAPTVGRVLAGMVPRPTPTITVAEPGTNLAYGKPVRVSKELPSFLGSMAVDGNPNNRWGSGSHAPEWIEIDLGAEYSISEVKLLPSQSPTGETVHDLKVKGTSTNGKYSTLQTFRGMTADYQMLSLRLPAPVRGVRYVRVETVRSPSWVSWREIEIIAGS